MNLKIVLVGCGQIADGHAGEIAKIQNASLVAVCDMEPIMAEQLALRFAIPAYYSDFKLMLEQCKPDVVHICTPPGSHLDLVKQSVEAGCHVYVEKPLALDYRQTKEIIDCVKSAGVKLTIGHNSEFEPPALEMRRLIKDGHLGDPIHVESWFGYNLSGPFGQAIMGSDRHWVHRLPGKLFHNNLNHMLNKITEFIDDEEPEVSAIAWMQNGGKTYGDVRDDMLDELRVTIKGEKVSAYGTFTSNVKPVSQFVKVYGSKAILEMDYNSRTVTVDHGVTLPSAIGRLLAGYSRARTYRKSFYRNLRKFVKSDYHYFAGMNHLFCRFYDCIRNDTEPPITYASIQKIAWIMDEIFVQVFTTRTKS